MMIRLAADFARPPGPPVILALLLAVTALLCGCARQQESPFYAGQEGEVDHLLVQLDEPAAVDRMCRRGMWNPPQWEIKGCWLGDRVIVPVPMTPDDSYSLCIIGHELMHATFGFFHPAEGSQWRC